MSDEPLNDEQQPESTPHFDAFSGQNIETKEGSVPASNINPNFDASPNASSATPNPIQNEPMNPFAPESVIVPQQTQTPGTTTQPDMPVISTVPRKWFKQKKFIIAIVAAVLIVLVGGGSAYAYVSYYQNPQKVITDSLVNAFTAKTAIYTGTLSTESYGTKVTVEITSKTSGATGSLDAKLSISANEKTYSVNGAAVFDKNGDVYFKVENLTDIIAEAKSGMGILPTSPISIAVDKLVAKIDGTWVKISSDDIKQYSSETANSQTCINDTIKKFQDDKTAIKEVADVYSKNQFIVVDKDLGQKDGSFGYQITSDNVALKAFAEGLKGTKVYKSLNDCDKTFVIDTSEMSTKNEINKDGTINLWVDVWSHQITKAELNGNSNGTKISATIKPKYNQTVTITAPSSSITLTQLQTYIQDLMSSLYSSDL